MIREIKCKTIKDFSWFKRDSGTFIQYLNKYSPVTINEDAEVSYLEYKWRLNEC